MTWNDLQQLAHQAGLADLKAVPAGPSMTYSRFTQWVADGCAADMAYLTRFIDARRSPESVLPGVRTLLAVVLTESELLNERILPENTPETPSIQPAGTIIPYACAKDYHTVLRQKLEVIRKKLTSDFPHAKFRIAVDTTPLLEKEWAVRAGLGQIGKNALLIHREAGPSVFLGFLLTTLEPENFEIPDSFPILPDPCINCDRCTAACPTGALRPDRTVDARKCLNYWTIESRTETVPQEIKEKIGNTLFGCDRCRKVCPKNTKNTAPAFFPLEKIQTMTEEAFSAQFAGTPVQRLGLDRLKRNARWISGRF